MISDGSVLGLESNNQVELASTACYVDVPDPHSGD